MIQHITIGFDKPQAIISVLLSRSGLENHHIHVDNDTPEIMITVTDNNIIIGDVSIDYPLLINNVIAAIKYCDVEQKNKTI